MMYLLALLVAFGIGFLTLRLLIKTDLHLYLRVALGAALGLGIVSQIIFYVQLLGGVFNHLLPIGISLSILGFLYWRNQPFRTPPVLTPNWTLWILAALLIPLCLEAAYYPLGGWDAWSCWNLKAKFIYLGEDAWKDMFNPVLWRSNTHYPLALPTLNVWFWQWTGLSQSVPMCNSVLMTLLTAAILLLGLQELKISKQVSAVITALVFTLAFGNMLSISQYSDNLFSMYLLSAFVCYLLYHQHKDEGLLIATAVFVGLLSFTKNEGLVASGILGFLLFIEVLLKKVSTSKKQSLLKRLLSFRIFITALCLTALPTIIFLLWMAPHNEAFTNGLLSSDKPSTWLRLEYIFILTAAEIVSLKWNGLWILAALGVGLGWKKAFSKPLNIIGIFCGLYLLVVMAYYQVNTFFEIGWWIQYTLNRIIFVLMPSVFLWMTLSLFKDSKFK